jgi:hypothetical protein
MLLKSKAFPSPRFEEIEVKLHSFLISALYDVVNFMLRPVHPRKEPQYQLIGSRSGRPGGEKNISRAGIRITGHPVRSLVTTPTTLRRKNSALVHFRLNVF